MAFRCLPVHGAPAMGSMSSNGMANREVAG
jgi:hypothetical protein